MDKMYPMVLLIRVDGQSAVMEESFKDTTAQKIIKIYGELKIQIVKIK